MKKIVALLMCLLLCLCAFTFAEDTSPAYAVGDTVVFGSWGGEAIEWQVMEVKDDGTYVLFSIKGLDAKAYNTKYTDVTWEDCTLRAWLNGEFYETAFTDAERAQIVLSSLETPNNKRYGTKGSNPTEDYVYLLSLEEVGVYFDIDPYSDKGESRRAEGLLCMPTQTALEHGAWTLSELEAGNLQPRYDYPLQPGLCWWWLRSPGKQRNFAARVVTGAAVRPNGRGVEVRDGCVRPAVCVRLPE